jgi:formylglycine-generating enzyme required for sulfatase activity
VDSNFVAILQKLVKERGKEVLLDKSKCKAFLADYTRNEYKKESNLLYLAIEAGSSKAIYETGEMNICMLQQISLLQKEKFLASEFAIDIVDTLALVLRGITTKTEPIRTEPARIESARAEPIKAVPSGFVRINGGTFLMGSHSSEAERSDREGPQHKVTVSAFYMGKYEVTQAKYESVMGTNPSRFTGSNLPVESVTWNDAVKYCNRLSQREGLTSAYQISGTIVTCNWNANGYRLPTEAEWEYACRAGTTTPFNTGNNITTNQANYDGNYPYKGNPAGTYREETTAVGSFAPNAWGLYDMHGNVWEWCWDWYGSYSSGAQTNPRGPVSGSNRVRRGGGWYGDGRSLRSAGRSYDYGPSNGLSNLGFRLVRP